ncbi:MAG: VOC family protein [Woeseiaceae bacterium]|nr:VOC family protein [Woeseiaceae bacterium]
MSNDPIAPASSAKDAFSGPIACITLITNDAEATRRFYCELLGMQELDNSSPPETDLAARLWGLPDDYSCSEMLLGRPSTPGHPALRVLVSDHAAPSVRPDYAARLEGGLSVGFAMRDIDAVVERGARLGFRTTAGVGALDMQRADETAYQVFECHFTAPDDVYALGVQRPPDLAAIGPIADGEQVGGPAYTGQVMNHRQQTLAFYTEVLGYEVRRRMTVAGPLVEQGLGLPAGTSFEFLQVFAPGSSSGYFIVLDFGDAGLANECIAPPCRGIVLWTFPVRSADTVAAAAAPAGCEIIAGPLDCESTLFGRHRAVSVRTANGFIVECVEYRG